MRALEDPAQKRVAATTLPDGKWVSTVWLAIDHRMTREGPPIIFETMVFAMDGPEGGLGESLDCDRYATEAEAKAGHAEMVAKWSKGEQP